MSEKSDKLNPPPVRVNLRKAQARLHNIPFINEYGLKVPSEHIEDYEIRLNNNGNLWRPGFNYKENAKKRMNNALIHYQKMRANAQAKIMNQTGKNTRKGNNTTRKLAFS